MSTRAVDVLVVGGGPAGLATAARAASAGSVLVVHRDAEIGLPVRTSGGSWVGHVTELGIPPELWHPIGELCFAGPTREVRTSFGADRPAVLDVTGTYRYLADLARTAGAEIRPGTRFTALRRDASPRLQVTIADSGAGNQQTIEARYVVDASGHGQAVLRALGQADTAPRFGLGVEYEFDNRTPDDHTATLFVGTTFAPAGYGWIFPTNRATVRVGIGIIRPDTEQNPKTLLERFLASDTELRRRLQLGAHLETHTGVIPAGGPAPTLLHGRVLSVGDSAGQALPLVGEGIRYVIEAGRRAGDAIAHALDDPASESDHLAGYAHWWSRKYRRAFARAQRLNERISAYDDEHWDARVPLAGVLDGDQLAAALRMELGPLQLAGLAVRNPVAVLSGLRRLTRFS